jgi:hypothetical protein
MQIRFEASTELQKLASKHRKSRLSKYESLTYNLPTYYRGVCYNERCSNEQFLSIKSGCYNEHRCCNEQFLSIKSGCYNEHRYYNEREGILSADVARACARRVEPSSKMWTNALKLMNLPQFSHTR